MEELRKAPNDELSFIDEVNEVSACGKFRSAKRILISVDRRFR